MKQSKNTFVRLLVIIMYSSLFFVWSCNGAPKDEQVIQLDTYLIHASENGEQISAPIFPGELSVNYINEVLQNMEQIHAKSMQDQKNILEQKFGNWKGSENEQTDDILMIGIKI